MEVIEHLDAERLPALERTVFVAARPTTVIVTTPNAAYNVRFEGLPPGALNEKRGHASSVSPLEAVRPPLDLHILTIKM